MGPVAEAEFIGSVKAPEDPRLQMLKFEGETLVHLCKQPGHCGRFEEERNLVHVHEWKTCRPEQIDHAWVTPRMRNRMVVPLPRGSALPSGPAADVEVAGVEAIDDEAALPPLPDLPSSKAF